MMAIGVTDEGLEYVKGLNELQDLMFVNTKVSDTAVEDLRTALPKCYIVVLYQEGLNNSRKDSLTVRIKTG